MRCSVLDAVGPELARLLRVPQAMQAPQALPAGTIADDEPLPRIAAG